VDSNGNAIREEVYAGGKHLATYANETTYFDHDDLVGTERARTSTPTTGTPCETIASLPFGDGQTITGSCGDHTPMHFMGKERDPESNLDDFGARFYSSTFGRWMSPDWSDMPVPVPYADLTNPQSLNLYALVRGNPETFADLDGHDGSSGLLTENTQTATGCNTPLTCDDPAKLPSGLDLNALYADALQASTQEESRQQEQNDTQLLMSAQDAARENQNLQPNAGGNGTTHCNQATCEIAQAMNAPMGDLTDSHGNAVLANTMASNLAKSNEYKQVSPDEAQRVANEGKLVIAAQPNPHGHGHVATVRPGYSIPYQYPMINNIGKKVGVVPATGPGGAFSTSLSSPQYFTPN
jgi:RHS repeat-associated protein